MASTELLAIFTGVAFVLFCAFVSFSKGTPGRWAWVVPTLLSFAFFVFSLICIIDEGLLGFWTEHTRNGWGNQIWLDLLFAAGVAWVLIVPQARKVGMLTLPWLVLIVSTGSIGLLAMMSRLMFLQQQAGRVNSGR